MKNKGNPYHDESGKFTSKIKEMGFDDAETQKWLKLGYDEKMYDPYDLTHGGFTGEDLVEFLSANVELTDEEKEVIIDNEVIPYRFVEEGYFDEEFFIDWLEEKEGEDDDDDSEKFRKNPYSFLGIDEVDYH